MFIPQDCSYKHLLNKYTGLLNMNLLFDAVPFYPNKIGYEMYREFHSNCYNGLVHTFFMPIAVTGVFLMIYGLIGRKMEIIKNIMTFTICLSYATYNPWYISILTLLVYHHLVNFMIKMVLKSTFFLRYVHIFIGLIIMGFAVGVMEFLGHGTFEHHHSHLSEVFNSIYHTPLFSINAIFDFFSGNCWI